MASEARARTRSGEPRHDSANDSPNDSPNDSKDHLPQELRSLVRRSVAILGEVIQHEIGKPAFHRIEKIRQRMASLRGASPQRSFAVLRSTLDEFDGLSRKQRAEIAHSFTLMLELMNA